MPQRGHCCPLPVSPLPRTATGPGRAPNSTQHPKSRLPGCVPAASPPPAAQDPVPVRGHRRCRGHRERSLWPGHTSLHRPGPAPAPGLMMDKPPPPRPHRGGHFGNQAEPGTGPAGDGSGPQHVPGGCNPGARAAPPAPSTLGSPPAAPPWQGGTHGMGPPPLHHSPGVRTGPAHAPRGLTRARPPPVTQFPHFSKEAAAPPALGWGRDGGGRLGGSSARRCPSVRPPQTEGGRFAKQGKIPERRGRAREGPYMGMGTASCFPDDVCASAPAPPVPPTGCGHPASLACHRGGTATSPSPHPPRCHQHLRIPLPTGARPFGAFTWGFSPNGARRNPAVLAGGCGRARGRSPGETTGRGHEWDRSSRGGGHELSSISKAAGGSVGANSTKHLGVGGSSFPTPRASRGRRG